MHSPRRCQSRPFGHIQESKGNLFHIGVVECLVDHEIKLDGMHPGDCHFIGAIEGFEFAKLELGRFGRGGQHTVTEEIGGWELGGIIGIAG